MANSILKNNKLILRCSNGLLEVLYEQLRQIVKEKAAHNTHVNQLIAALDQEQVGRGFVQIDISDFLKTAEDMELFTTLVKSAIDNAVSANMFNPLIEQRMREFQEKINI